MINLVSFIPRAVVQGIPLLFGSTGEIMTQKPGNLNLGIPGVMYVGAISGVMGSFFYEQSVSDASNMNAFLAILIPIVCCLLASLCMGLLYCFLTVTLRANQNVTGLAMTTFGVGFGNFFGGSLIKLSGSDVPSIALSATSSYFSKSLPFAENSGWFGKIFLSYGFLAYVAVIIALVCAYVLKHTRVGLHLRAVLWIVKQILIFHNTKQSLQCINHFLFFWGTIFTDCTKHCIPPFGTGRQRTGSHAVLLSGESCCGIFPFHQLDQHGKRLLCRNV